ncbi:MAG TPA: 50S ribosomal protein L29 [Actinomycetaceae bacterium]|nr:50S ribosomal protein L29 [Actinomycetaceae bacterium]
MAIGTEGLSPSDLDKMDDDKLAEELANAKDKLFKLRFSAATGQLEERGNLKKVRRDIARIYTIQRERELNIRSAPTSEK